MPPKQKKKAAATCVPEAVEPSHDPTWERAVISGLWQRPVAELPDSNTWPSWGALRQRVLLACHSVTVPGDPSVRDAFVAELVRLSPPRLRMLDLAACRHLRSVSLSPATACPALESINLRACPSLQFVLIQSVSCRQLDLTGCEAVTKVLLQCPRLSSLAITGCSKLAALLMWSDELQQLDLGGAAQLVRLELTCPGLSAANSVLPQLPVRPVAEEPPRHAPIATMLRDNMRQAAQAAAEARECEWKADRSSCGMQMRVQATGLDAGRAPHSVP